ncbi:UvrD-helicase domain-containing protein, partial [Helicobacter suis]|uniref:UvrD-helicase domain-containing protein n=1 Tax=Helicobacter suis TaxID=104628 RepID=UPI0013150A86
MTTTSSKQQSLFEPKSVGMQLTKEQEAVVTCKDQIVCVEACAGSGKTTTMLEFCKNNKAERILYLCFNKGLSEEVAAKSFKMKLANTQVKTLHASCYAYLREPLNLKARLQGLSRYSSKQLGSAIESDTIKKLNAFMQTDEKQSDDKVLKAFEAIATNPYIPITHDYYVKYFLTQQIVYADYSVIIVDEAQDLNGVMLGIIANQVAHGKRIVLVGDTHQKIYGFMGNVDGFAYLRNLCPTTTLNLTQSFRCPNNIAHMASKYLVLNGGKEMQGIDKEGTIEFWLNPTEDGKKRASKQMIVETAQGFALENGAQGGILTRANSTLLALFVKDRDDAICALKNPKDMFLDLCQLAFWLNDDEAYRHFLTERKQANYTPFGTAIKSLEKSKPLPPDPIERLLALLPLANFALRFGSYVDTSQEPQSIKDKHGRVHKETYEGIALYGCGNERALIKYRAKKEKNSKGDEVFSPIDVPHEIVLYGKGKEFLDQAEKKGVAEVLELLRSMPTEKWDIVALPQKVFENKQGKKELGRHCESPLP